MNYKHTQEAPLYWILAGTALAFALAAVILSQQKSDPALLLVFLGVSALTLVIAYCFKTLTVEDDGDHLLVYFGPIHLFRKRIPYNQISNVKRSRSKLIDGWGIHYVLGRGWTWNLWGYDCIEMRVKGTRFRIGTDEPEKLAIFVNNQLKRD